MQLLILGSAWKRENILRQDYLLTRTVSVTTSANSDLPQRLSAVQPAFTQKAFDAKAEGKVEALYDVDLNGDVKNIRIVSSRPKGYFEDSVMNAMSQWKYEKNKPAKTLK